MIELRFLERKTGHPSNILNYRDRAVGTLLMYTGLRSCDIANLKMQDIHWIDDIITIYQQKTSVALTLPLRAIVGNSIFDYITKERPQSKDSNLFVSETRPHRAISSTTVSMHIAGNIFNVAEVRMRKSDRRGSHIFRHLLAITLLENGIPQPAISSTLGHTSPDSTETYLSADFTHLKECGINIVNYPINEEVFNGLNNMLPWGMKSVQKYHYLFMRTSFGIRKLPIG